MLDRYHARGLLSDEDYGLARAQFMTELLALAKLRALRLVPVRARILEDSWELVEKHHIYEADALQIATARATGASEFYTADRRLHDAAVREGLRSFLLG